MQFSAFAALGEQLAATNSRLQKAALVKEYLTPLDDDDLVLAARFLSGRPFALADQRVLQVGYALVRDVVCQISGAEPAAFSQLSVQQGEAGAAAEIVLQGHSAEQASLTLRDVAEIYAQLVQARGPSQKRPILVELLRRATPLEAKYIIKIMGGDLRIGLLEGQLEDALARMSAIKVREVQWANMLLGDIGETALLARRGLLHTAYMRLFHPLKFMLASPIQDASEIRRSIAGAFFVEDKYDGIRGQVHKQNTRVAIYSRTLDEMTERWPDLHAALLALPGEFILDGEILGARDGNILPFKELQTRLGRKQVSAEVIAQTPVMFVAYDILYQDDTVLLDTPLAERRARLERLLSGGEGEINVGERISSSPRFPISPSLLEQVASPDQIDPLFDAARARGNEGLMVKDPASGYAPGRRGREWLKVKKALATLDVVVTAAEVGNGKRRHVLSDYTFAVRASAEDPTLLNVGKAYSGLTDAEIAQLTEWFHAHTIRDFGRVKLVEPQIILEVAFDIVQPSARHKSGYALRFPRIVRIRDDKSVDEIDTLATVRQLAETGSATPAADSGTLEP